MLYANLHKSSTFVLKAKIVKTLFDTLGGNCKDQNVQHCRVLHHSKPLRAQTVGGENPRRKLEETPGVGAAKDVYWKQESETLLTSHQDHIADRRYLSMCHYGLVRTPIRFPKAMKIPAPRAAQDRELGSLPAWSEAKVRAKADLIHEAQNKKDFIAPHSKRHTNAT